MSATCKYGSGNATRYCHNSGVWSATIDNVECVSSTFLAVLNTSNVTEQLSKIFEILVNTTKLPNLEETNIIIGVLSNATNELTNMEPKESVRIGTGTAEVINILASDTHKQQLMNVQTQTRVAQTIINIVENQNKFFATNTENKFNFNGRNLFIENRFVSNSIGSEVIAANSLETIGGTPPKVQVPIGTKNPEGLVISVAIIRNIGELITEFSNEITIGTKGVKLVQFENLPSFVTKMVVTPLVSVQFFVEKEPINNIDFKIILPLDLYGFNTDRFRLTASCLSLGDKWFDEGINNVSTSDIKSGIINCQPKHTTAFVALIAISRLENQSLVLNLISYIGCCVSIISLILSLTIYTIFGRKLLRKIYHFIHFNLAISLLLLYTIFVGGIEVAYGDKWDFIPCKIVSGLIQYLILVVFIWMLVEGVVIVIMIYWPFHVFNWRYFVFFSITSYLIPVLYLIPFVPFFHEFYISPPVIKNGTGTGTMEGVAKYCFLHADVNNNNFIILTIVIPVALIIGINIFLITFVAIRFIIIISRQKSFSRYRRSRKTGLKLFRLFIVMFPLLGFGWTFGLLAVNSNLAVFSWIFTILGSSQGFFFLVFVLLLRQDVQNSIITTLKLKTKLDTVLSQLSQSRYGSPRTSVVSNRKYSNISGRFSIDQSRVESVFPRLTRIDEFEDFRTKSDLELAERAGLIPPTIEIEDLLTFIEHPPLTILGQESLFLEEIISLALERPERITEFLPPTLVTSKTEISDLMMFYEPQLSEGNRNISDTKETILGEDNDILFDSIIKELEDLINSFD